MSERTADGGTERRARRGGSARAAVAATRVAVAATLVAALAGCGEEERATPQLVGSGRDGPTVGATPGLELPDVPLPQDAAGPRQAALVQIAAFPDSAAALRLRDSLGAAGWRATVRAVAGDTLPPWRVRVAPTTDRELVQLVLAGWQLAGARPQIVGDTASPGAPEVRVHPVNRGARGARTAVRWLTSPDRRALLVVEDPAEATGAPLPDAFLVAAEDRPTVVQRDSVWDVAPSPTWDRVAFGRAFLVRAEGRDAQSAVPWLAVAARTNMDASRIRRGSFAVGVDGARQGFAQPVIEPLAADSAEASLERSVTAPVPIAGGWRVRWSRDGRTLGVGLAPARAAADDAPPSGWVAVDVATRLARSDVPAALRTGDAGWTVGPTVGLDARAEGSATLRIAGGEVRSAGGWITVRGGPAGSGTRVIGPGTALAATAGGRFVAALAPSTRPGDAAPSLRVVVYELIP